MQSPSLSKSACTADGIAGPNWDPGYAVDWRYRGRDFAVADWRCRGGGSPGLATTAEFPTHFEINLQRCGWHLRQVRGREYFIDRLRHVVWPHGVGYDLSQHLGKGQSATLLFLDTAFVEATLAELPGASASTLQRALQQPSFVADADVDVAHGELLAAPLQCALTLEDAAMNLLRRLFPIAESRVSSRTTTRSERAIVHRAVACLHERYDEDISLVQIARAVGVSASRLSAVFPRETGMTLWQYVRGLRLQRALHLLAESRDERGLSDLALGLGFNSHSHFSQAFRARYGVVPSAIPTGRRRNPRGRNVRRQTSLR
jgi:AraC-like DNA-binding protein